MKQEGIYYERDDPGQSYSVIFLNVTGDRENASEIGNQIRCLYDILQRFRNGQIRDLPKFNGEQVKRLTFLIGYGRNLLSSMKKEGFIPLRFSRENLPDFNRPSNNKTINIWNNAGFDYSSYIDTNKADADLAIQFISDSESDTKRAVLETLKFLHDNEDNNQKKQAYPLLELSGYYSGFQRTDNRNMLDFLDGISNLASLNIHEREKVIYDDGSTHSGPKYFLPSELPLRKDSTFMCFLRILIDLRLWRRISAVVQEQLTGREKVSGCPLLYEKAGANKVPGCPVPGTDNVLDADKKNEKFLEVLPKQAELEDSGNKGFNMSHIARVRGQFINDTIRIFRQGYNFFEESNTSPYFKTGLNFVSFQNDPSFVHTILTSSQWMGGVTYGGNESNNPIQKIMSVEAAGMFFVPPMTKDFPGSEFF